MPMGRGLSLVMFVVMFVMFLCCFGVILVIFDSQNTPFRNECGAAVVRPRWQGNDQICGYCRF